MCMESLKGSPSYNDLAARYESSYRNNPSKQAISKKVNLACVEFFQAVLAYIINAKYSKSELDVLKTCDYRRVLIQDSTLLRLPFRLFNVFSGHANGTCSLCNARVQGVYDLVSGRFVSFSIDPYSKNDAAAASDLEINTGDLSLRDRGYFSTTEMKRHLAIDADFIFRYRHNITLYHAQTHKPINLCNLLVKKGSLDMEVGLDKKCNYKVRLIAEPVNDEIANRRRRITIKDGKGHNPSANLLKLMSWSIFITSIKNEKADFNKVLKLYGLRWRIEIIFKGWKSHMHFSKLHNVSENQLRVMLTARLIMTVICIHYIYNPSCLRSKVKSDKQISMFKLIGYLSKNPEKMIALLYRNTSQSTKYNEALDKALLKYCTYDKRIRTNFAQVAFAALN